MKKNIGKILAVILVVALLATVLCACVPSNFTKAKENLEGDNYVVTVVGNGDLVNGANAMAKVAAAAYDVTLTGKCDNIVTGVSKDGKQSVTIYYFDNAKDAKAFNKACKANVKKAKDELKKQKDAGKISEDDYKKALEEMKDGKFGVSGKAFYIGTKAAVKACN